MRRFVASQNIEDFRIAMQKWSANGAPASQTDSLASEAMRCLDEARHGNYTTAYGGDIPKALADITNDLTHYIPAFDRIRICRCNALALCLMIINERMLELEAWSDPFAPPEVCAQVSVFVSRSALAFALQLTECLERMGIDDHNIVDQLEADFLRELRKTSDLVDVGAVEKQLDEMISKASYENRYVDNPDEDNDDHDEDNDDSDPLIGHTDWA